MRPLLFLIVSIATSHGRLIERSTEKFPTIDIQTSKPNLPIRLTRAVFDEDTLTTFSREREYAAQSDEFQYFNRRARHYVLPSPKRVQVANNSRHPRESSEKVSKSILKNSTTSSGTSVKVKEPLVKKPIAKFSEVDYDDDFQTRMIKSPAKFLDSGEHEDEDFNLDDYDFDINHDEFSGRGKPLEPRTKSKEQIEQNSPEPEPPVKASPAVKIQSKLVIPQNGKTYSNKKERSAIKKLTPRRAMDNIKDDDYNYDETTTAKRKEKDIKQNDGNDDYGDEIEDSKEIERKSVRTARSTWNMSSYVDKLGEKTSTILSKVFNVLPMFPQLPYNKKINTAHSLSGKHDPSVENIVKFNHIA